MIRVSAIPVIVDNLGLIPGPLGGEICAQISANERVLALVWIPADRGAPARGPWARTRGAQVLALTDQRILIGAEVTDLHEPRWVALTYGHLLTWTIEQHLLHGKLVLRSTEADRSAQAWLEFHTSGSAQIMDALAPMERAMLGLERSAYAGDRHLLEVEGAPAHLTTTLAQHLLPSEFVRRSLFQPMIRRPSLRVGQGLVGTPTLISATDRRLIIVREIPHTHTARYGDHCCSLPRYRAGDVVVRSERGMGLIEYAPNPQVLRVPLEREYRPAAEHLLESLQASHSSPPGQATQRLGEEE